MLSPRWTALAAADSGQTHCSVVAVQLTLRTDGALAVVDTWISRIGAAAPPAGLLGGMLERTHTHLRVVSAWSRRTDMAAFERGELHRDAKDALREHVLPPTVAVWTEHLGALPPNWSEVQRRLDAARVRERPQTAAPSTPLAPPPPDPTSRRTTP